MKKLLLLLIGLFTFIACDEDFNQINEDLRYLDEKINEQYQVITDKIATAEDNLDLANANLVGLEETLKSYVDGLILELTSTLEQTDNEQDLEIQNLQSQISLLNDLIIDVQVFGNELETNITQIDSLYQELSQATEGDREEVLGLISEIEQGVGERVDILSANVRTTLESLPDHIRSQVGETLTALNLEGSVIEVVLEQFTLEVTELTSECDSIIDSLTDAQTLEYNELRQNVTPEGLQASVFTDTDGNDYSSSKDLDCDGDITLYDHILLYIVGLSSF